MKHTNYVLDYSEPILYLAIHNGHNLSVNIKNKINITDADRLREEDPYTDRFISDKKNHIIQLTSRFECDLNRTRFKSIYQNPEDCWGMQIYHADHMICKDEIAASTKIYDSFYGEIIKTVENFLERYEKLVIWDIHSYNHRRNGQNMPFDSDEENPEIIIGTTNYNYMSLEWKELIDTIQNRLETQKLHQTKYENRPLQTPTLDVRQNVKFSGGHLSQFLNFHYGERVCCIPLEFKKIWMNEWTGQVDEECLADLKRIFDNTAKEVLNLIS